MQTSRRRFRYDASPGAVTAHNIQLNPSEEFPPPHIPIITRSDAAAETPPVCPPAEWLLGPVRIDSGPHGTNIRHGHFVPCRVLLEG